MSSLRGTSEIKNKVVWQEADIHEEYTKLVNLKVFMDSEMGEGWELLRL